MTNDRTKLGKLPARWLAQQETEGLEERMIRASGGQYDAVVIEPTGAVWVRPGRWYSGRYLTQPEVDLLRHLVDGEA